MFLICMFNFNLTQQEKYEREQEKLREEWLRAKQEAEKESSKYFDEVGCVWVKLPWLVSWGLFFLYTRCMQAGK